MKNKYAVIVIEYFDRESLGDYPVIDERENYAIIEYNTEPNPTGEHWVIFEGEDANVRCAEYLATLNHTDDGQDLP